MVNQPKTQAYEWAVSVGVVASGIGILWLLVWLSLFEWLLVIISTVGFLMLCVLAVKELLFGL